MTRQEKIALLREQLEEARRDLRMAATRYVEADADDDGGEELEGAASSFAAAKRLLQAVLDGRRI